MRRSIAIALGALTLGGCSQLSELGEAAAAPPQAIIDGLSAAISWLAGLIGPFLVDVFTSLF